MLKPIARHHNPKNLYIVSICSLLLMLLVFASCTSTSNSIPPPSEPQVNEYTETQIVVSEGEIYRFDIFADEYDTIEVHWKPSSAVYCWYTDPNGLASPLYDYGTGPNGERVTGVNEPTQLEESPSLRVVDAIGYYLYDDPMDGDHGGQFQIQAYQAGYYSICFMPFYSGESVSVTIRYRVK
jgi:hypothetical protein